MTKNFVAKKVNICDKTARLFIVVGFFVCNSAKILGFRYNDAESHLLHNKQVIGPTRYNTLLNTIIGPYGDACNLGYMGGCKPTQGAEVHDIFTHHFIYPFVVG